MSLSTDRLIFYFCFQVLRDSRIRMGKISKRPASIAKHIVSLDRTP